MIMHYINLIILFAIMIFWVILLIYVISNFFV